MVCIFKIKFLYYSYNMEFLSFLLHCSSFFFHFFLHKIHFLFIIMHHADFVFSAALYSLTSVINTKESITAEIIMSLSQERISTIITS